MAAISDYVSYSEGCKSQTAIRYGIDNTPSHEILEKMRVVANLVFDPMREYFNKPIAVVSFYRCLKLNTAIGGAVGSQHMKGEAMDIDADVFSNGITNKMIFNFIRAKLDFDQLIGEVENSNGDFEWIHVSYKDNINNRHNVLVGYYENGRMKYKPYENT